MKQQLKKKIVIAVVGDEITGKTGSICNLAKLIPLKGQKKIYPPKTVIRHEATVYGTYSKLYDGTQARVGITTFGDSISLLTTHFVPLIDTYNCDVVVVACHNDEGQRNSTLEFIRKKAADFGYNLILTSVIHDDSAPKISAKVRKSSGLGKVVVNGVVLNEIFAVNMINLINALV